MTKFDRIIRRNSDFIAQHPVVIVWATVGVLVFAETVVGIMNVLVK